MKFGERITALIICIGLVVIIIGAILSSLPILILGSVTMIIGVVIGSFIYGWDLSI